MCLEEYSVLYLLYTSVGYNGRRRNKTLKIRCFKKRKTPEGQKHGNRKQTKNVDESLKILQTKSQFYQSNG
jgi:hypothetical protein